MGSNATVINAQVLDVRAAETQTLLSAHEYADPTLLSVHWWQPSRAKTGYPMMEIATDEDVSGRNESMRVGTWQ